MVPLCLISNPAKHHVTAPLVRPDSSSMELPSPRISQENHGPMMQTPHVFPSTWTGGGVMEVGRTGATEQSWMYRNAESGLRPGGSIASISAQNLGQSITPPQPVQASTFVRPAYAPTNSLWDARGLGHHRPSQTIPSVVMTTNAHSNQHGPPFLPASVTPLAQIQQGSSEAQFNQMFSRPVVPPPLSSLPPPPPNVPPQSDFRPPLPPHPVMQPPLPPTPPPPPPPPPPHFQPPAFPPPSSPPTPPPSVAAHTESFRSSQHYPWQGVLSKSGVHYCTMNAQRVDSDICNYSNAIAEPAE